MSYKGKRPGGGLNDRGFQVLLLVTLTSRHSLTLICKNMSYVVAYVLLPLVYWVLFC